MLNFAWFTRPQPVVIVERRREQETREFWPPREEAPVATEPEGVEGPVGE
jgi:hypothetical protein